MDKFKSALVEGFLEIVGFALNAAAMASIALLIGSIGLLVLQIVGYLKSAIWIATDSYTLIGLYNCGIWPWEGYIQENPFNLYLCRNEALFDLQAERYEWQGLANILFWLADLHVLFTAALVLGILNFVRSYVNEAIFERIDKKARQ